MANGQLSLQDEGMEWIERGACGSFGQELFIRPKGNDEFVLAKTICKICPVSDKCLAWAQRNKPSLGIWGGYSTRQRRGASDLKPVTTNPERVSKVAVAFFCELAILYRKIGEIPSHEQARRHFTGSGISGWAQFERNVLPNWTVAKQILTLTLLREADQSSAWPLKVRVIQATMKLCTPRSTLFSSAGRAMQLAGVRGARTAPQRPRFRLLQDFVKVCKEEERVLRPSQLLLAAQEHRCAYPATYRKHFGSHDQLVEAALPHLPPDLLRSTRWSN